MASPAFLTAWSSPRAYDVIRVEIASPAASSPATLMRLPVDKAAIASASSRWFVARAFWVSNALVFVLMTVMRPPKL